MSRDWVGRGCDGECEGLFAGKLRSHNVRVNLGIVYRHKAVGAELAREEAITGTPSLTAQQRRRARPTEQPGADPVEPALPLAAAQIPRRAMGAEAISQLA